jgi:opacity protein-like surface antigen
MKSLRLAASAVKSLGLAASAAALCLGAAAPACAQEARQGAYVGVIASALTYKQSGADSASLTSLGVLGGQVLSPHWAVEGRLSYGIDEDSINVGATSVPVEVGFLMSGLVKGILPLGPRFGLYGLGGVSLADFRGGNATVLASTSEAGLSYGGGVEIGFLPTVSLTLEWLRLFDRADFTLDAASLAFNFRF